MIPRFVKLGFAISAAIYSAACTYVGAATANLPTHFNGDKVVKNVAYSKDSDQTLDIYIPPDAKANSPVLVFYYGGAWQQGSKEFYKFVADAFTREGYIVVLPDYRKYPAVKFPTFVEDGADALAWVYKHIGEYGGDNKTLFISGHSAGAHIASMLATDDHYLEDEGLSPAIITGFLGLSGPYSFEPKTAEYKAIFGPPSNYPNMRATTFVDGDEPPMLLIHGTHDRLVGFEQAQRLEEAMQKESEPVEVKVYQGLNHIQTVGSLSWIWSAKAPVKQDMLTFMDQYQYRTH